MVFTVLTRPRSADRSDQDKNSPLSTPDRPASPLGADFKTGPAIGLTCMIPIAPADLGSYSA